MANNTHTPRSPLEAMNLGLVPVIDENLEVPKHNTTEESFAWIRKTIIETYLCEGEDMPSLQVARGDAHGSCVVTFDGGLAYDLLSIDGDYHHMGGRHYWESRDSIEKALNCEIEDVNGWSWTLWNKAC